MLSPSKQANKEAKQGFFFSFHGDQSILSFINLRVELTIILEKPFVSTISMVPLITEDDWISSEIVIEPLINVEVFGQAEKEFILANKSIFKEDTLYIYFPSNVRVDEKVNKMYLNSYQSIIKEIPRQFRGNFTKLIIFEKGTGELSIDYQKNKCSEMLCAMFKHHLERRIEQYVGGIASIVQSQINIKSLLTILKSKYGLAHIYRKIGVNQKAQEVLDLLWQDILFNQKLFNNGGLAVNEYLLLPPFTESNYSKISKNFFSSGSFLKTCLFCFLKSFELDLELMSYCEAMRTLKKFIEVSMNNIQFSTRSGQENAMLKHMWIITVIEETYEVAAKLGRTYPTILNSQKEAEYHHLAVHIARTYRSSLEILGAMLYNFNPQINYPRNFQYEINCCLERLQEIETGQKEKMKQSEKSEVLENKVGETFLLIFGGYECFKIIYMKSLVNFYQIMSRSTHYLRMARALKALVLKVYLSIIKPEKLMISDSYLTTFGLPNLDIYGYIDAIMKKAEKIVVFQQDDPYMINSISKKMVRYSIDKDDYVNRNRQDEVLWPNLKFIEDYYKFIILLQAYRYQSKNDKNKSQNSLSFSFSIVSNKIPIKTDNIIHLLLNSNLMGLEKQWQFTLKLVREIFLLEKGEEFNIEENVPTSVRLGILLEANIKTEEKVSKLIIKLNNQQLINLKGICSCSDIGLSLLIADMNHQEKHIQLKIVSEKMLSDGIFQLEFQIIEQSCLIFIIKELQIKIGLLVCYYVNKSIEIQEIKQLEESADKPKKKSRKYSSFEQKLKEEEFVHMINKSEQLALAYLHYNTLYLVSDNNQDEAMKSIEVSPASSKRKGSMNVTRSVRSNSNMSLLYMMKDRVISNSVYKNLWSPLTIKLKPNYYSKHYSLTIFVSKIFLITCEKDQISEWMSINGVWVNRLKTEKYSLDFESSQGVDLMFMVKSSGHNSSNNKQNKYRKQSEMSQSIFSNTSFEKGETMTIKMDIQQQHYRYRIEGAVSYVKTSAFEVKYYYCQDLEQYTFFNVSNHTLKLKTKGQEYEVKPREEVKLMEQSINLAVVLEKNGEKKPEVEYHHDSHELLTKVDLRNYIKRQLLRPEKVQTFELTLCPQEIYRKAELIQIKSQIGGNISVLDPGRGFEIVGKIQGCIQLNQNGVMDLYLIAVESGRLLLPRLLIDSKKGVWKDSVFIEVYD